MPGKCIADMYRFTNTDKKVRCIPETTNTRGKYSKIQEGEKRDIFSKTTNLFCRTHRRRRRILLTRSWWFRSRRRIDVVFLTICGGGVRRRGWSTTRVAFSQQRHSAFSSFVEKPERKKSPLGVCECVTSDETLKYSKKEKVGKSREKHPIPIDRY